MDFYKFLILCLTSCLFTMVKADRVARVAQNDDLNAFISSLEADQSSNFESLNDLNALPHDSGSTSTGGSFGISKTPLGISKTPLDISKTPWDISATPLDISATPLGISKTPLGISKTPLGVSKTPLDISKTPLDINKPLLGISAGTGSLLTAQVEVLRLVESFLRLKGELMGHFLSLYNDNWEIIRAVSNFLVTKVPTLHHFILNAIGVFRNVLEFAVRAFSEWSFSISSAKVGALGNKFSQSQKAYGVPSMDNTASFLDQYTSK